MVEVICFNCQTLLSFSEKVGLREECTKCGSDVHVCKNCQFYDPKVYNECKENQAEYVRERDRFNRCDYFTARLDRGGEAQKKADSIRAAAEALFKKK